MKLHQTYLFLFFLLTASLSGFSQTQPATLPDFKFYTLEGGAFTKKDISHNSKFMLVFFDATCEHCQRELGRIGDSYDHFKNIPLYLISMDEVPAIKNFMATYGKKLNGRKNVTLLQDKDHVFISAFMPTRYPAIYVYTPAEKLIKYYAGETPVQDIIAAVK